MKDKVCSYLDQVGVWLESPDLVENAYNPVNVFTRTFMAIDSVGFAAAVLEGIDAGKALKAVIDAGDSEKLTAASYAALQTGGAWSVERLRDLQDGDFLQCNESEMVLVRKVLSPDATDVFYSSPETGVCKDRMRLSKTENGMLLGFEKREDLVVEKLMVLRLASC